MSDIGHGMSRLISMRDVQQKHHGGSIMDLGCEGEKSGRSRTRMDERARPDARAHTDVRADARTDAHEHTEVGQYTHAHACTHG